MISNLAYVGVTSPAADEWRSFGTHILGAQLAPDEPDGAVRLRVDERAWRIAVHPGAADAVSYIGWDLGGSGDHDAMLARLAGVGVDVRAGDADLAAVRQAEHVDWFVDPFGFRHELVLGADTANGFEPPAHLAGRFLTGDQGLGHVVLMVPEIDVAHRFATEALGFGLSDQLGDGTRFYHCRSAAARHHSLAMVEVPGMVGLHHVMLELTDPDDVGRALDRVRDAGIPLAMDYGRHPNDLMTSFYVRTPSGFEVEYGSGGLLVDDATWEPDTIDRASIWGHRPPADGPLTPGILRPVATSTS